MNNPDSEIEQIQTLLERIVLQKENIRFTIVTVDGEVFSSLKFMNGEDAVTILPDGKLKNAAFKASAQEGRLSAAHLFCWSVPNTPRPFKPFGYKTIRSITCA